MHTPNAIEASFIFFPQPQLRGDPSHVGLRYQDVWLTADDGIKLHSWFIRGEDSGNPQQQRVIMLITHGNGGNISVRLDQYREFVDRFRFIDIFALEYRGYGLSEGAPSEDGIALDAIAARRWIGDYIAGLPEGMETADCLLRQEFGWFGCDAIGIGDATRRADLGVPVIVNTVSRQDDCSMEIPAD